MQINEGRKKRLLAISELRLSYADYEDVKEGMERSVSNMFSKLGSVGAPKVTKKKKKEKEKVAAAAAVNPATGEPAGISGLGLVGMDGNLQIPPEIYEPVTVLRRWKGMVGSRFEEIERESPGLVWGLPKKSIYEGLEEEIAETQKTTASSFAAGSSTVPGSSNSVNESRSGTSGGSANDTAMAVDERQSSPEDVVMQTT
jgi:transcriptional adapter 3